MKMNTRCRSLTLLLVAFLFLNCEFLRTLVKFDDLPRKLRRFKDDGDATSRSDVLTVQQNNSLNFTTIKKLLGKLRSFKEILEVKSRKDLFSVQPNGGGFSKANSQPLRITSTSIREKDVIWNDNLKHVTIASANADTMKGYPTKHVPQTTTTHELSTKNLSIYPKSSEKYSGYGDMNCKRNQNRSVFAKIFEHWIELAKKENIEYFLTCGTLLGVYRNGDLIPDDRDMDVLVNRKDFLKIKKYSSKKKFNPYAHEINIYVHNDFYEPFEKRRRFKCSGEVCELYRVSQKNFPFFKLHSTYSTSHIRMIQISA